MKKLAILISQIFIALSFLKEEGIGKLVMIVIGTLWLYSSILMSMRD